MLSQRATGRPADPVQTKCPCKPDHELAQSLRYIMYSSASLATGTVADSGLTQSMGFDGRSNELLSSTKK